MTPEERIAEWDPRQRFRPYRVTARGEQEQIAYAGCETHDGIGCMLVTLKADGEFTEADRVGILDTVGWSTGEAAEWLVNPHATGK